VLRTGQGGCPHSRTVFRKSLFRRLEGVRNWKPPPLGASGAVSRPHLDATSRPFRYLQAPRGRHSGCHSRQNRVRTMLLQQPDGVFQKLSGYEPEVLPPSGHAVNSMNLVKTSRPTSTPSADWSDRAGAPAVVRRPVCTLGPLRRRESTTLRRRPERGRVADAHPPSDTPRSRCLDRERP